MGAEVPGGERPEAVWPSAELPAPAEEQGELGDSSRGRQGNQEEHRVATRQGQPQVKPSDVSFYFYMRLDISTKSSIVLCKKSLNKNDLLPCGTNEAATAADNVRYLLKTIGAEL